MKGNVTTIYHPGSREPRTFAFDHSYWSHDGCTENEAGVYVKAPGGDPSAPYADQVGLTN